MKRPPLDNKILKAFLLCAVAFLFVFLGGSKPALAEGPTANAAGTTTVAPAALSLTDEFKKETLLIADEMTSDDAAGIVTSTGHVEIARNDYILHADKVTYNRNNGVMTADGHVAILMPTGEVEFAQHEEVTGDMEQAFAENIGILFPDSSRFAAKNAQRYEGRYLIADKGVFTACNVCKENPDEDPLWQLRGSTITHDNEEHEVYYHNATIDFAGVPVLYTPYFSAPDPTVKRRQGFLTPMPGVSPTLGDFIQIPYYFDIAPETDAVLSPTFSTVDTAQMAGEIRHRFANGNLQFNGSFTHADLISDAGADEGQQWRGHLVGNFLYNIDNVWRAGTDIAFTSDKSYLQRYRLSSADELVNRAYIEGFKGRDYFVSNAYYFEDIRPGSQPVQPLVMPDASFSMLGEPGQTLGGRWSFDGSALATQRDNKNESISQQGPDTRRLSMDAGWQRQFTSNTGLVTTLSGLVRGDSYWADNVIDPNGSGASYNDVKLVRQFEQGTAVVRYPMARQGDGYQQLIEPIIAVTAAPAVKPRPDQPIEDSLDVEFDETNLFASNRFTGTDLIEGGSRGVYGLRHVITTASGQRVDMFGGQSYDLDQNAEFPALSGLHDHTSDYVGRIDFLPVSWLNMNYGFRLDHQTLAPQRQDILVSGGEPIFQPYIRYLSAYQTESTGIVDKVQEATVGFSSLLYKYWTVSASHTQAFEPEPGPRGTAFNLNYVDECFIFGIGVNHDDTQRADISAGTSVMFHFFLRNLGGVHTDSGAAANFAPQFRQH